MVLGCKMVGSTDSMGIVEVLVLVLVLRYFGRGARVFETP